MDAVDQWARDSIVRVQTDVSEMVRRDVYLAEQATLKARIAETEKDLVTLEAKMDKAEERRAADRRLILTSLVLPIVVALILLYVQSQIGK